MYRFAVRTTVFMIPLLLVSTACKADDKSRPKRSIGEFKLGHTRQSPHKELVFKRIGSGLYEVEVGGKKVVLDYHVDYKDRPLDGFRDKYHFYLKSWDPEKKEEKRVSLLKFLYTTDPLPKKPNDTYKGFYRIYDLEGFKAKGKDLNGQEVELDFRSKKGSDLSIDIEDAFEG